MPGTLQELRVTAYLDLLQERDSRSRSAPQAGQDEGSSPAGQSNGTGAAGPSNGTGTAGPDPGPSVAALITITVPSATLDGRSAAPGDVGGFGLLDAEDTRVLIAAGLTCQCGLAPLCRHHHRCKQAEGWRTAGTGDPGLANTRRT